MSPAFLKAFDLIMEYEGGYSNDADDPGGETRWGISKRSYPTIDIASLTKDQAQRIYFRDFWLKLRLDEIADSDIAGEIFEQAVNLGIKTAIENLEMAMNYLGVNLTVDGIIGFQTISAINGYDDKRVLMKVLNGEQYIRYKQIVKSNPLMAKYAKGWMKRVEFN